ncbi:MAG: Glu-tRNA(Gln) amidotransferase subunit GatE [Thermoproteota archaeon]
MELDYQKIGLKVGLEIHQQLDIQSKLFCSCKSELSTEEPESTFLRRLRPTQSELGQVDPAAYFEFQKGVKILYESTEETSCLVEMDEEPPHPLNQEAVEAALTAALMMEGDPVDEIHVMRKTVIDGSNTTGFQRTCVISLGGEVDVEDKTVPIEHVSLEEDAARKMGEKENLIRYRIDRLGIPLVEVATAPVIKSPEEAEEIALALGKILRATDRVKRGLGTIRQDLNISLPEGALMEIKGVQELELLPLVVRYEVQRQRRLIQISKELQDLNIREERVSGEILDVTSVFQNTDCEVLQNALKEGYPVLAVKLPGFKGFLGRELMPDHRLGTEMADRASFWGRVKGVFHTDELPAYGIKPREVEKLRKKVEAEEEDAVVLVADQPENAEDALKAVVDRAREAITGVPAETRAAQPDGTTRYTRPRPGAARMYPETDIPPVEVSPDYIQELKAQLPELPEKKFKRLREEYQLNRKLTRQILDSSHSQLFETIASQNDVAPTTIAVFLTETLKSLKRDGTPVENLSENQIQDVFRKLDRGALTKEALPEVTVWLSRHPESEVQKAIGSLDLEVISEEDITKIVEQTLQDHKSLIQEQGERSFGRLMGTIMKELRGKVDASLTSKILKEKLKEYTEPENQ